MDELRRFHEINPPCFDYDVLLVNVTTIPFPLPFQPENYLEKCFLSS